MKKSLWLPLAAALSLFTFLAQAADDDHVYKEGPVVMMSTIRTQPGMFEEYMRYLAGTYKGLMEEYKKQGVILDYAVYTAIPTSPDDADLILTVTYKNMAAMDNLQARTDPIDKKVWGTLPKADQAYADRSKVRKELGTRIVRQLILK